MHSSGAGTKTPIDLSHLSGEGYQKQIFERLVRRIFDDSRVLDITNYGRGEVDYIVREHPGTGILAANRFHYFECKNYSRSLELDNVAKVMVVAVADQPLSVHVVSRSPLQPQIRKYASRLFNFDGSTSPLFRGVEFRHWQTGNILDDGGDGHEHNVQNIVGVGPIPPDLSEVHWWLSECSAFSEVEIASSELERQAPHIRTGTILMLSLEFADIGLAEISLDGLPRKSWGYAAPSDSSERGRYIIDTALLATGEEYRVSIRMTRQKTERVIPLVYLHASGAGSFLPELRAEEIADLIANLGPSGETRLTLVDGEAGVGKTHLIEKVAERLRATADFDILRVTVPEDPDDELMEDLIRNCLAPAIGKNAFSGLVDQIETVLLRHESGGSLKIDFRLLARVASRMGPRVIVLRDCHQVTPKLADEIWMLISVLDDASWGGIRLLLEYRQPDADANSALQGLLRKIRLNIRKVLLEKQVTPLARDTFYRFSKHLFAYITDELIACLFNRTGGFPLFLDSYLHRLQDLNLIRRREKVLPFEISEPARVLADSLSGRRQVILEERIRTSLAATFPEDWSEWAIVLGLIATADNAYGQSLILDALGISEQESHVLRARLREVGIGAALPDGQIVFRHDLLREAVATVATAVEGFEFRAREVADNLLKSPLDEVKIRAIRVKIFALLNDDVSCELELRNALKAAQQAHDYGRIVLFLNHLLPFLKGRPNVHERLDLMRELAWASWVSDSLLVARGRYRQLAAEAEGNAEGDFSLSEAIATHAYRRAIGLDLELMEPYAFLKNTISVLGRRQDHVTFNSILNRLVLFCARFGLPEYGYRFADLAFEYIGDGKRENEGSVLCSELGMLYASSSPDEALDLFRRAHIMADGKPEQAGTTLAIYVNECMYHGKALDTESFDALWAECSGHRLTEPLARASLLKGSLLLREGNLKSAAHWIERTATMVQLYHLKQFELSILVDQVLHALLSEDTSTATKIFGKLVLEFERVDEESVLAMPFVEETFKAAEKAASLLLPEPSTINHPSAPPTHCDPAAEMRRNIAGFASLLGLGEAAQTYQSALEARPCPEVIGHRCVDFRGTQLILGAY